MGICLSFVPFLDACHRAGAFKGEVLGLGNLEIHETIKDIGEFAGKFGHSALARDYKVRSLLKDRYQVADYTDCDINDKAELYLDLAAELEPRLVGRFGTILNAGTVEHIFDQYNTMRNLHRLLHVNGTVIHLAPITWYEHAFYNLNPSLFHGLARSNGYEILAEGFHTPNPIFGEDPNAGPFLYLTYSDGRASALANKIPQLANVSRLPARILYMIALRKCEDREFTPPYDIAFIPPAQESEVLGAADRDIAVISDAATANNHQLARFGSARAAAELLEGLPMREFTIPPEQIVHDSGHCYRFVFKSEAAKLFTRVALSGFAALKENGAELLGGDHLHDEIRSLGAGRVSYWNGSIYFSTFDNSDPRTNHRRYSVTVPAFIEFIERLPASGISQQGL